MNEVDGQDDEASNQAAAIGTKLGLNWLYAPAEQMRGRDNIGNAVLTDLPVTGYARIPMRKTKPDGYRNIILLHATLDGTPIHVIVTHTDGSEDRDAQLKLVTELFTSLQPPVILMGDFNTRADHPMLRALLDRPDVEEPLTTTKTPARKDRIDWLFTRGLHITNAGFDDRGYSDHPMIWAEMTIKK
ncbi:MAG: endonuclease/exonuclease/phosphatase family protein [Tepidisphaeraceae bacterium]